MLKFEVPQDGVFFSVLGAALHHIQGILEEEQAAKIKSEDSAFPWVAKAFGYAGALKAIDALLKEQENDTTLVQPTDYHLHLIHQAFKCYNDFHNEEVRESGIQELDGYAIGGIKHAELVELYLGDIDSLRARLPEKGKLKAADLEMKSLDADPEWLFLGDKYYTDSATYPQLDSMDETGPRGGVAIDEEDDFLGDDMGVTSFDDDEMEQDPFAEDDDYEEDQFDRYGMGDDEDNWGYDD